MTNAAIYTRISQDREGAGLGVQRQEQDCRQLAQDLGYSVVGVYSDNDTSAYSGKPRPEYQRMLEDIASGRMDAVIVWHTDRLTRSPRELEDYIKVAESIPTHTVKAGVLDLSTASGRMTARITGAVARHESEHKSERQKRKADELASQGLPLGGGRPFGYESDGLTIRESEAQELRAMVARVLAGDSLGAIMRDLNSRGVLTTRGGTWGYSSLRTLLLRERNCGRMVHRGQVIGKAAWEPILTESDHDAVAALLAAPGRRTTTGPARRHLLSGLAKCSCGRGMKPGWVKSKGHKYWIYTCPDRSAGHAHRSMRQVDEYVTTRVLRVLDTVYRPANSSSSLLEEERAEIDGRLQETALMYAEGKITAAQLAAITSHLEGRLTEIANEVAEAAKSAALDGASGITREEWDALPLDRKRRIIDTLVRIEVVPLKGERRLGVNLELRVPHGQFSFSMPADVESRVLAAL